MFDATRINGNNNNVAGRDININININQYSIGRAFFSPLVSLMPDYVHLSSEEDVIRHVREECVTVLHAISGMGKTAMAQAVGNALKEEYTSLFLEADELSRSSIQTAVLRENVEGNVLLIIDNMSNEVEKFAEWFESQSSEKEPFSTKLIITTQNSKYVDKKFLVDLPAPRYDEAKKILFKNLSDSQKIQVTEEQLQIFIERVSALPLVLRLVNNSIKCDDMSFTDFFDDDKLAISLDDESSEERVIDRLLRNMSWNHQSAVGLLKWLGTAYGDRDFLDKLIGKAEMLSIGHSGIFASTGYPNINSIKMHDIVYQAILHCEESAPENAESLFWHNLLDVVENEQNINAVFCYKKKIAALCSGCLAWDFKTYFFIRVSTDGELLSAKLNEKLEAPDVDIIGAMDKPDREYAYKCIIEFRERWQHILDTPELKKTFISETCNIYKNLLDRETEEDLCLQLRHHLGKAYFWLEDMEAAIGNFEVVLQLKADAYESMLQLARCYKRLKKYDDASSLLEKILNAGYDSSHIVHTSVLLAALNELRYDEFQSLRETFVIQNWEQFKEIILNASNFDYDQPFETFVAVGNKIAYEHPELYGELAGKLPIRMEPEEKSNQSLFNAAEYCMTRYLHSKETGTQDKRLLKKAELYFGYMKHRKDYQLRKESIVFLEQEQFDKALEVLGKINKFDRFAYYRRSQAYLGLNKLVEAEKDIDVCIDETVQNPDKYLSTFYVLKGDIRQQMDQSGLEWYQKALEYCKSEKYKAAIGQKIEAISRQDKGQ